MFDSKGPEVIEEALKVLKIVAEMTPEIKLNISTQLFGGAAIDATGQPLPQETLESCKAADAVLMGTPYTRIESTSSEPRSV